jgi:hypothetical protein
MDNLNLKHLGQFEAISAQTRKLLAEIKEADGVPDDQQAAAIGEARAHLDVAMRNMQEIAEYLSAAVDAALLAAGQ